VHALKGPYSSERSVEEYKKGHALCGEVIGNIYQNSELLSNS